MSATNTPEGALDVWLRIPDNEDEADAEANTYQDGRQFRVDWYLNAVGLVKSVLFDTYEGAMRWLEAEGFQDFTIEED